MKICDRYVQAPILADDFRANLSTANTIYIYERRQSLVASEVEGCLPGRLTCPFVEGDLAKWRRCLGSCAFQRIADYWELYSSTTESSDASNKKSEPICFCKIKKWFIWTMVKNIKKMNRREAKHGRYSQLSFFRKFNRGSKRSSPTSLATNTFTLQEMAFHGASRDLTAEPIFLRKTFQVLLCRTFTSKVPRKERIRCRFTY